MLLIVIYAAFISLGLPDALLGSAWPLMQPGFSVPFPAAGWISMTISSGTIVSSVCAGWLLRKLGVGRLTAISVALTSLALFGFASASSFAMLLLAAIPLGLGAGAVDAGLNAFVAERYESRHMSWLHAFWGVGALSGPFLLSAVLARDGNWRTGYVLIGALQAILAAVLILILPLWRKARPRATGPAPASHAHQAKSHPFNQPGVKTALLVFFCYCGIEASFGLWGASFLVKVKGLDAVSAARWISSFYAAITAGRLLAGFLSYKVSNANLIRGGALAIAGGILLMLGPLPYALWGFVLAGLGCAPVFPCMLHETPSRFGVAAAPSIAGYQMAAAYAGTTLLPPAFGFIASEASLPRLPFVLLGYTAILAAGSESLRWRRAAPEAVGRPYG